MVKTQDLDAPAKLQYAAAGRADARLPDWGDARDFASLREAVHVAMTEDPPAGKEPFILTGSGAVLAPATLEVLFDSLQGP